MKDDWGRVNFISTHHHHHRHLPLPLPLFLSFLGCRCIFREVKQKSCFSYSASYKSSSVKLHSHKSPTDFFVPCFLCFLDYLCTQCEYHSYSRPSTLCTVRAPGTINCCRLSNKQTHETKKSVRPLYPLHFCTKALSKLILCHLYLKYFCMFAFRDTP